MPDIDISDNELLILFKRIAQDDREAFTKVFLKYYDYILPFASRRLKSEEEAMDLIQEVFLRLWLYRASLSEVLNPKAYIYRIIYTTLLKHYEKLQKEIDFLYSFSREFDLPSIIEPDVAYADLQRRFAQAIALLPSERKRIFLLRQNGLMPTEIAQELNLSINTVKTQLKRAFSTVREFLSESGLPAIFLIGLFDKF